MVLLIIIPIKWLSIAIPAAQSHATLLRLSNPPRRILRELRQGGADLGPALRGALHLPRPASGVRGDGTRRLQGKNGGFWASKIQMDSGKW